MIQFQMVEIQNFLPFSNVGVALNEKGVVAIRGQTDTAFSDSNGAGKSAVFEALYWCLYGELLRGGKADDVVNNRAKKDCSVMTRFLSNGRQVMVCRYRKDSLKKNTLEVLEYDPEKDEEHRWVDKSCQDMRDTQAVVDGYLGLDKKLFGSTVVFGGKELASFMNAGDAGRKALFEKLLGLERFEAAFKAAGAKADRFDAELNRHAQTVVQAGLRRDEARDEAARHEAMVNSWAGQQAQKIDALLLEIDGHAATEASIVQWQEYGAQWEENRQQWEAHKASSVASLAAFDEQWGSALSRAADAVRDAEAAFRDAHKEFDRVGKLHAAGHCPTCGQETNDCDWNNTLRAAETARGEALEAVEKAKAARDALNEEYVNGGAGLRAEMAKADDAIRAASDAIRKAGDELTTLRAQAHVVEGLKARLGAYKGETNPHLSAQQSAVERLAAEERRIKEAESLREKALDEGEYFRFWRDGFSRKGVRSFLLDSVIPEINARASEYARILTDGDIQVAFTTQVEGARGAVTEKFDVQIASASGGGTYDTCSSGERRRIDLCVALAIHDLIFARTGGVNCVFLDEVFDTLDATGAERVVELLKAKAEYCKLSSVFVVTHNRDVANLFPNAWTVVKQDGMSKLEV